MLDLWLALAGLLASSVNAAAGGGTLLSFPSLLAAGLTPIAANATSTFGLLPGYLGSMAGYREEARKLKPELVRATLPAVLGGALGAWLLIHLGGAFFARIVPALLIGASALLLSQPLVARFVKGRAHTERPWLVTVGTFLVAIYGGYFGAGAGILFLASMGLLYKRDLGEVNLIKVYVSLIANVVAAVTFALLELQHPTGTLHFRAALPLAVGAVLGGYLGVRLVRRLPPTVLRGFAAAVGLAIALFFIFRR